MADAGGTEVAKIAVRVVPNMRGFRQAVEFGVKREMKGYKYKVQVSPDTKGFAAEVTKAAKGAAKAASGNDVKFDTDLDANGLGAKARAAAAAVSGNKIKFGIDIDRRGLAGLMRSLSTGWNSVGVNKGKDMNRAQQMLARHVSATTRGLVSLARQSRRTMPALTNGMKTFGRSTKAVSRPVVTIGKGLTGVGRQLRRTRFDADRLRKGFDNLVLAAGYFANDTIIDGAKAKDRFFDTAQGQRMVHVLRQVEAGARKTARSMSKGGTQFLDTQQGQRMVHVLRQVEHGTRRAAKGAKDLSRNMGDVAALKRMAVSDEVHRLDNQLHKLANSPATRRLNTDFQKLRVSAAKLKDDFNNTQLGNQLGQSMSQIRAGMDQLSDGPKKFVKDWTEFHSVADRARMAIQGAKDETNHLRNSVDKLSKAGMQRVRDSTVDLGNKIKDVGNSDGWTKFAKGAENAARSLRGVKSPFQDLNLARPTGAMTKFNTSTKNANKSVGDLMKKVPLLGGLMDKMSNLNTGSSRKIMGLSRVGWIILAVFSLIAPAISLVGALLAGLPTLIAGFGAAAAVMALGWDGIKDAVKPLGAAFAPVKELLSGTFRDNLTPVFENLAGIAPQISDHMNNVAIGLSNMTKSLVDSVMGSENIDKLNSFLDQTGQMFTDMGPGMDSMIDGFLTMFDGAAQGFPAMTSEFNKFFDMFSKDMSRLVDSGVMKTAMEGLATTTGSLMTGLHKMLVSGVEHMPEVTEGLVAFFDGFASMIVKSMPLLTDFSNFMGTMLGTLGESIGNLFVAIQPGLSRVFTSMSQTFGTLIQHIGPVLTEFAGSISLAMARVAEKVGPIFERLAPRIATLFETLGDGIVNVLETLTTGDTLDRLAESFLSLADAAIRFSTDGLASILPMLPGLIESLANLATTLADGLLQEIIKLADDALPQFVSALQLTVDILNVLMGAITAISENKFFAGSMFKGITGLMTDGPVGAIKGFMEGMTGAKESTDSATESVNLYGSSVETAATQAATAATAVPNLGASWQGAVSGIMPPMMELQTTVSGATQTAVATADANLGLLPGVASARAFEACVAFEAGIGSLTVLAGQVGSDAANSAALGLAPLPGIVSGVGAEAASGVQGSFAPLPGIVAQAGDGMTTAATTSMGNLNTEMTTGVTNAGTTAATLVPTVQAGIGNTAGVLTGSGATLVDGFVAGMRSRIGAVRAAANEVAGAARDSFPNSPAKQGPFSGKGYTPHSGEALVKDFAGGMLGARHYTQDAANDIAGDIKKGLEQYQKSLDGFQEHALVHPIMESNAGKLKDFHEREAEVLKNAAEARAKAIESGGKDQAKAAQKAAEVQVKAAEDAKERRDKLLESLEVPDFRDINTSIQSYYIDGTKGMFQASLLKQASDTNFAGQLKNVALQAVKDAREVFGDHPVMAQVEANVNTEYFGKSIQEAIEASEIGHIPVELAISNLEQFKSDIGMGDGAISRALTAVMEFNPNNTDAYRNEKATKEEIHYHVADMNEAMRMEDERRRRGALRYT